MSLTNQKAFTLIELLIVVAIIGVLAAVGIPMYQGYLSTAKELVVLTNHSSIKKFIQTELVKCSLQGNLTLKMGWNPHRLASYSCAGSGWGRTLRLAEAFYQNFRSEYHEVKQWTNPYVSGFAENPAWNNGCHSQTGYTTIYPDSTFTIGVWTRLPDRTCKYSSIPTIL